MNVVLPAPFGPISPTNEPGSIDDAHGIVGPQAAERDGQVGGLEQGHQ